MSIDATKALECLQDDLKENGWRGLTTSDIRFLLQYKELVGVEDTPFDVVLTDYACQYAMSALNESFLKKLHNNETDKARDEAALQLFLDCNSRCQTYTVPHFPEHLELIWGEFQKEIYNFFYPSQLEIDRSYSLVTAGKRQLILDCMLLTHSSIAKYFALGSGSNIGSDSTDFYTKYVNSTMASTSDLLHKLFVQAISSDDLWSRVESFRAHEFGYELVRGSRLSFVPKSAEISRTICTEPVLNMLFQKGIGLVIEERLKEVFNIDLSIQPDRNRRMAEVGSVSGELCTIDLKSASDSISLSLLERILPEDQLRWFKVARSERTVIPDGREIELHMVSSMGNGFTFPLQTLLFACAVKACYKRHGLKFQNSASNQTFGVFGDDIVVHRQAYSDVCEFIEALGFTVNTAKSFNSGYFRESCGRDFFCGRNVRGVYIKTLISDGDVYSAINRLIRWSTTHYVPVIRTIRYLRCHSRFLTVPFDASDDAGIKVPRSRAVGHRTDRNLTTYYRGLVNSPIYVRVPRLSVNGEVSSRDLKRVKNFLRNFRYSSDGLLFVLLAGFLRSGRLGLRNNLARPKTVYRWRATLDWDAKTTAAELGFSASAGDWDVFCAINLEG